MTDHPTTPIAKLIISAIVCAAICLFVITPSAECESRVHVRKKFIPKPHIWESVNRIAILPIEHTDGADAAAKFRGRTALRRDFPDDSALSLLIDEMRRQIQLMDSAIVVVTVDKPTFKLPDSALARLAGNVSGADAVLTMCVTKVDYNVAAPEISGGYAMGAPLPPIKGKPASTSVRMRFTMKDVKYGDVIWQIDADGRETAGGVGGDSTEAQPPESEVLMKDIIIAAGAWLPFDSDQLK